MFTGIVEAKGKIFGIQKRPSEMELWIETGFLDLALGESVAVHGVCLTVAQILDASRGRVAFYVSPETLRCTVFGELREGQWVNLERALPAQGRFSGHWVQGHVDGLGCLEKVTQESQSYRLEVSLPSGLFRYCVDKGSITVNGVSLTVNRLLDEGRIELQLIPHTWENTHFSQSVVGESLNIEIDILAKYMERLCHPYLKH